MKLKTELLDTYNDMLELKASLGYNKDTYRLNIVSLIPSWLNNDSLLEWLNNFNKSLR